MPTLGNVAVALRRAANEGITPVCELGCFQGTGASVGTTADLKDAVGPVDFKIVALTAETIQVQGSYDNSVWSAALVPFDKSTMNFPANAATLAVGEYRLPLNLIAQFRFLRFVKSGAVNTTTVAYSFSKLDRQK